MPNPDGPGHFNLNTPCYVRFRLPTSTQRVRAYKNVCFERWYVLSFTYRFRGGFFDNTKRKLQISKSTNDLIVTIFIHRPINTILTQWRAGPVDLLEQSFCGELTSPSTLTMGLSIKSQRFTTEKFQLCLWSLVLSIRTTATIAPST